MDGTQLKRTEIINAWFHRAELVLRKIYQGNEERLKWNDEIEMDVKSIAVSYLSNYVSIIDPNLKPALLQIVARLADLEIADKIQNIGSEKPSLKLVD